MKNARVRLHPAENYFRRGVREFNSGKFFEAHESWEVIWLRARPPDKTFLQGITQVTAAFHHGSRGNRAGFRSLLGKGLAKLENFRSDYRGLRLEALRRTLRRWLEAIRAGKAWRALRKPKIRFAAPMRGRKKVKSKKRQPATGLPRLPRH